MTGFIEKLIERLEEEHERCINRYGVVGGNLPAMEVKQCMEIVNQLAEEYKSNDVCEWKKYEMDIVFPYKTSCGTSDLYDDSYKYCPYCGKKIKVTKNTQPLPAPYKECEKQ